MPAKFETTVAKIERIPNKVNRELLREFLEFLKQNGSSERHQNDQVKAMILYAISLGNTNLQDVNRKEQLLAFLDLRIKSEKDDPEKKWITTWNDYSNRLKFFFRWFHNQRGKQDFMPVSEWETPTFARIRHKKTKRLSPYSETEIWDLDELLSILPYERQKQIQPRLSRRLQGLFLFIFQFLEFQWKPRMLELSLENECVVCNLNFWLLGAYFFEYIFKDLCKI